MLLLAEWLQQQIDLLSFIWTGHRNDDRYYLSPMLKGEIGTSREGMFMGHQVVCKSPTCRKINQKLKRTSIKEKVYAPDQHLYGVNGWSQRPVACVATSVALSSTRLWSAGRGRAHTIICGSGASFHAAPTNYSKSFDFSHKIYRVFYFFHILDVSPYFVMTSYILYVSL